jgi:hypothetical protein
MKFIVQGQPEFRMALTLEDVAILMKTSAKHYDSVCREASATREFSKDNSNFITSWQNILNSYKQFPLDEGEIGMVTATWRQIDTCLKILEQTHILTDIEQVVAGRIRYDFIRALSTVRPLYDQWRTEFDTAVETE